MSSATGTDDEIANENEHDDENPDSQIPVFSSVSHKFSCFLNHSKPLDRIVRAVSKQDLSATFLTDYLRMPL